MKNDILKTVSIIMVVIFTVFIIALGALYVFSQDRKYDWDARESALPVEEVAQEENVEYFTPDDVKEEVEYKFNTEDICDLYLYSKSSSNPYENYWFRYQLEDGKLYLSCNYTTEKCLLEIDHQEIDADRFDEVFVIINRFTMANTINDYRDGKPVEKVMYEPKEGSDIQDRGITMKWDDGAELEFGYPHGAGDTLVKYFIRIAGWMTESQNR